MLDQTLQVKRKRKRTTFADGMIELMCITLNRHTNTQSLRVSWDEFIRTCNDMSLPITPH